MDKTVSVRFFDVYKTDENGPAFEVTLQKIIKRGQPNKREARLGENLTVRLERFERDADGAAGEFTRVQTTNYPSEVRDYGLEALNPRYPLGHGIAFRFRRADSVLAVQYEPRVLAPSRINSYLQAKQKDACFRLMPRMRLDVWNRLEQNPLRKLTIGIASPSRLADIEDDEASVAASLRRMGDAYDAPNITVELSMGSRAGSLGESAKEMAKQFFTLFQGNQVDLRKLRGVIETEQGNPNDEINLIDEVLSTKETLPLPDNDPEQSFRLRRDWLIRQMQDHV